MRLAVRGCSVEQPSKALLLCGAGQEEGLPDGGGASLSRSVCGDAGEQEHRTGTGGVGGSAAC